MKNIIENIYCWHSKISALKGAGLSDKAIKRIDEHLWDRKGWRNADLKSVKRFGDRVAVRLTFGDTFSDQYEEETLIVFSGMSCRASRISKEVSTITDTSEYWDGISL